MNLRIKYNKLNIWKTILFNFKFLPFKQAIKIPILIHGKFTLRPSHGNIVIDTPKIRHGMINIGFRHRYVETNVPQSIWTVNGSVVFAGNVNFYQGSYVLVARGAKLSIGTESTVFGSNIKIFCFDSITIGNKVRVAWDVQLIDTSFHYVEFSDMAKPIQPLTKPITIGNRVWIGNRSTISKGSVIVDDSIIASNSLVNKDLSKHGNGCLFAGCPAVKKSEGLSRVWDSQRQKLLDSQFGYNRNHL